MMPAQKILVIDEDLDNLELLGSTLKREGFTILTSSSGDGGIKLIQTEQPDLVILDRVLGKMDGLELVRQLRGNSQTEDILVIVYSALSTPNDQLKGFEAGADDYLTKPAAPAELIARVRAILLHAASRHKPNLVNLNTQAESLQDHGNIGVMSAKGGVGVSLLTVNLGIAIRQLGGQPVLVTDFRPGGSTMAAEIGAPGKAGLETLLECEPEQITPELIKRQLHHHESGVDFLLASAYPQDARYQFVCEQYHSIGKLLSEISRFSVMDFGPAIRPSLDGILKFTQQIIIVLEPTPPSIFGTRLLLENLRQKTDENCSLEIVISNRSLENPWLTIDQVQEGVKREIAGVLSFSPELVYQAQLQRKPLMLHAPDSRIAAEILSLARQVMSGNHRSL